MSQTPGRCSPSPIVSFVLTFKVSSQTRLDFLRVSLDRTLRLLRSRYVCHVVDASVDPFAAEARAILESFAQIEVRYRRASRRMPQAWSESLADCETPFVVTMFDDQPIVDLEDATLEALAQACGADPRLDCGLFVAAEPRLSFVDPGSRRVIGVPPCNPFANEFREVERVELTNGLPVFVIRRYPFTCKFFFNNMFFARETYARRLNDFVSRFPDATAQEIELASASSPDPLDRFAYAYSRAHVVDIDFAHTSASLRANADRAAVRVLYDALALGYESKCIVYDGVPDESVLAACREGDVDTAVRWFRSEYARALARLPGLMRPPELLKYVTRNLSHRKFWTFMRYRAQAQLARGIAVASRSAGRGAFG
jgi:hypothetical protein